MSTITGQETELSDGVEGFKLAPAWKSEFGKKKSGFSLLSILFFYCLHEEAIPQLLSLKFLPTASLGLFPGQGGIPKLRLGRKFKVTYKVDQIEEQS